MCPVLGEFSVAQCFTYVSDNYWQVQHAITLPFCGPDFGESNKPSSSPTINKEKISKLNTKEKTFIKKYEGLFSFYFCNIFLRLKLSTRHCVYGYKD